LNAGADSANRRFVNHQSIACLLLAAFCGLQGTATAVIDLSRTHATHPGWLGHARFHVVWQTATVLALSVFEIALVLAPDPGRKLRFYLAAILASAPMFGFFTALFARKLYDGTLSDPGGIPPWTVYVRSKQFHIDLNVMTEILGLLSLAAIVVIYRFV
jgi:hypothetical protein